MSDLKKPHIVPYKFFGEQYYACFYPLTDKETVSSSANSAKLAYMRAKQYAEETVRFKTTNLGFAFTVDDINRIHAHSV